MQNPNNMQQKIEQFAGQVVTDLAAAMAGVMTNLGHKLGLYRAMAESGPINSDELARRTATNERIGLGRRSFALDDVGCVAQRSESQFSADTTQGSLSVFRDK
jgi:hypothetical protein